MSATPCPKVCVAAWLVELGRRLGIPSLQLVHVPYGLRHEKFRVVVPLEDRPPQVSMLYHKHPFKDAQSGLEALDIARRRVPGMHAVVFGDAAPDDTVPEWIDYRRSPPQDVLVKEIYNLSRVFVSSSLEEGFGLPGLEAMACGARWRSPPAVGRPSTQSTVRPRSCRKPRTPPHSRRMSRSSCSTPAADRTRANGR